MNNFRLKNIVGVLALTAAVAACSKDDDVAVESTAPAPVEETAPAAPAPAPVTNEPVVAEPLRPADTAANAGGFVEFVGGDKVYFALDSSELSSTARATLEKQADWLNHYTRISVTVEGHCDERGTREYNLALGERRANAVKEYLVALGVRSSRVNTVSYGKERPLVSGSGESVWSQNRRGTTTLR